jgi:predicted Zn-dependent protease
MVGSLYEMRGRVPDAIQRYEDAVRLDPSLAVAKNNLAYLLADTGGNLDRALDLAQEARGLLPDNANAADTLGWVLYKKNSPDAAVVHLREAVRSMEPDDPQLPMVRHHLALAYEAAGDFQSARDVVDELLAELAERRKTAAGEQGNAPPDPPWVAGSGPSRAPPGKAPRVVKKAPRRPMHLPPASRPPGPRLARSPGVDRTAAGGMP